jgi:hypothetical protein
MKLPGKAPEKMYLSGIFHVSTAIITKLRDGKAGTEDVRSEGKDQELTPGVCSRPEEPG